MSGQSQAKVIAARDKFYAAGRALKLARRAAYRQVEKDTASLRQAEAEAFAAYCEAAHTRMEGEGRP